MVTRRKAFEPIRLKNRKNRLRWRTKRMKGKKKRKENTKEGQDQNSSDQTTSATGSPVNEPIELLLEPFGKERLTILLTEAAKRHPDVADQIREMSEEDPIQRNIFVYGLGQDTRYDTLTAFKQYGEIEECTAVLDKISGECKGYGFIVFKSRSGARIALKEPAKIIGNRMTSCKLASETARASSILGNRNPRKILVSNVRADVDPQNLYSFFSRYGEIEGGPWGLDTGKPKGFCLFVYKAVESARRALVEPFKNFEGHLLYCQTALNGPKHNTPGHLVAPTQPSTGGVSATQALNPALGQSLPAQAAGLNLNPPTAAAVYPSFAPGGMPGWYRTQAFNTPGVMPGYGIQTWHPIPFPNPQTGQGSAGNGQHFGAGMGQ